MILRILCSYYFSNNIFMSLEKVANNVSRVPEIYNKNLH